MTILTVGREGQFSTIGAAIANSQNGDVILVNGGTYTNDFAQITDNITLQAVGGRVDMVATTAPLDDKGIFIIGDETHAPDVTINGFDFDGAQISAKSGGNGAGIRYQSGNLTLNNDLFVDNQDGLLATPFVAGAGAITIDHSEFGYNGSGTGLTHNLYVGVIGSLTITNSYFHDVSAGHEIKSRAEVNTIENDTILDLNGTASYSIDLPNGGQDIIAGNTIEKGLYSENHTSIITYYEASGTGAPQAGSANGHWTDSQLTVTDNTFLNDLPPGKLRAAIWNNSTIPVVVSDNSLFNVSPPHQVLGPADISGSTFLATEQMPDTSDPFLAIPTGGMITNSGLVIAGGNEILIAGSLIINNGTYLANGPGSYTLEAPTISGTGVLVVGNNGADLVLATNEVGSGQVVDFTDNIGTLTVDSLSGFTPNIIDGFRSGDSIHFAGGIAAGMLEHYSFDSTTGVLTITDNGGNDYTLDFAPGTSASAFVGALIDADGSGVACYLEGTLIRTDNGEVPVENLQIGDRVTTSSGQIKSIRWIGRRRIDVAAHPRPETVAPVRIQRDAFADGMPHSDVLVSPDHAIFVDGKLICARQLINAMTIRQEMNWGTVEYFHIELDTHAILLAHGLPAESYLDTGNRGFFANSQEPLVLHPDLTNEADSSIREARSCVPFVWDEDSVRPIWQRLAERAEAMGLPVPKPDATSDSGLQVAANGRVLRPFYCEGGLYMFPLPAGTTEVRLVSRASSPTDARPWMEDRRRLGVHVKRMVLRSPSEVQDIPLDNPHLSHGWWAVERDGVALRRWTNGDAVLPLPLSYGPTVLEISTSSSGLMYAATIAQNPLAA